MHWKEKFESIEKWLGFRKNRSWSQSVNELQHIVAEYPALVEVQVRAIYILHQILLEEYYSEQERRQIEQLLIAYFRDSSQKFAEDAEYLFFIGRILPIAEWYFGLKDDDKPIEKRLAYQMQSKAKELDPDNILYEWAWLFSSNSKFRALGLARKIKNGEGGYISWLKSKGFPGTDTIETIEYCLQNFH